ncbi:MAG: WG repeat-containing protein [Rikenellaceae bacterium]
MKALIATLCALIAPFAVATTTAQVEHQQVEYHEIITASGKSAKIRASAYWIGESNKKFLIMSTPSEATIEIDGKVCGNTPLVVCGFTKNIVYKITKDDYREQIGYTRTDSNDVGMVNITLNQVLNSKEYSYFGSLREGKRLVSDPETKLYGYVDNRRREVIPCKYDKAWSFRNGIAMAEINKLRGIINFRDETIVPFEYYNFSFHESNKYIFGYKRLNGKTYLNIFDEKGKRLYDNDFNRWSISKDELIGNATKIMLATTDDRDRVAQFNTISGELKWVDGFEKIASVDDYDRVYGYNGDKRGMLFRNGDVAIPAIYDKIFTSKGTSVLRCFKDDKALLIDSLGHKLCEPKYDYIYSFVEGRAITKIDSLYGFIDDRGVEIVEPKYRGIELYSEGRAYVKIDKLWGIIDEKGEMIVEPISQKSAKFSCGIGVIYESNLKCYYIDKDGNRLFDRNFREASQFTSQGVAFVDEIVADSTPYLTDQKYFINTQGEAIDTIKYRHCHSEITPNGTIPLTMQHKFDKYSFVDLDGVPLEGRDKFYRYASDFRFDVAIVATSPDEYYLVDTLLNRVSQKSFQLINSFDQKSKLALAKRGDKWGLIDTQGEDATEFIYDKAHNSFGDFIKVQLGDKEGYIDKKGDVIVDVIYDHTYPHRHKKLIYTALDNKHRYLDYSGKPTTDMWFDHIFYIESDSENRALTYRKGEFGVLDFEKGYIRDVDLSDYVTFNKQGVGSLRFNQNPRQVMFVNSKGKLIDNKSYMLVNNSEEFTARLTPMVDVEQRELVYIGDDGKVAHRAEDGTEWYYISPFDSGIGCVRLAKIQGDSPNAYEIYIDEKFNRPFKFDHLDNLRKFVDGIAVARDTKTQLYGIINTKGKWICEPKFVEEPKYRSFQDKGVLLCVKIANNYWQINQKGELVEMDENFVEMIECGWGF